MKKSFRVFHDRSLLGRCFLGFVLPVLEFCSAVWCLTANIDLLQLDRAVSGTPFLTGGVFERDTAHRRYVIVLCMVYKIMCNPMYPLNGALPEPCGPVRVTHGALVAHRYTYASPAAEPRSTSGTILLTPYSVVLTGGFQERGQRE